MDGDKNKTNPKNESVLDTSSPLYVNPSDYPKQLHVNDSLTDNNYADWSQEMLNFLFVKNKVRLIDGTLKKPDKTAPDYMAWMRADAMVTGWLTTAMEKDIRASVKYANTSLEIWNNLIERFGKESAPRAYELKQALTTVKQDGASVSSYYTRLRGMWARFTRYSQLLDVLAMDVLVKWGRSSVSTLTKRSFINFSWA